MTALIFVLCATCHFETAKEIFHDGYFLVQVDAVSEYVPGEKDQFGTFIIQVLALFQSEGCVIVIAHSIAFILLKNVPQVENDWREVSGFRVFECKGAQNELDDGVRQTCSSAEKNRPVLRPHRMRRGCWLPTSSTRNAFSAAPTHPHTRGPHSESENPQSLSAMSRPPSRRVRRVAASSLSCDARERRRDRRRSCAHCRRPAPQRTHFTKTREWYCSKDVEPKGGFRLGHQVLCCPPYG